jgi:amino acid transporter
MFLRAHDPYSALAGPLAYLNVSTSGSTVFNWFVNISSITGLITWDIILITYARFYHGLKYNNIDRDTLPYKAPFQPYATYFGIFFVTLVTLFNGFQVFLAGEWVVNTFITAYICLPIFLVFYLIWKIGKRTKFVHVADMDFHTGRRELDASELIFPFLNENNLCADYHWAVNEEEAARYVKPTGIVAKVWDWLSESKEQSAFMPLLLIVSFFFSCSVNSSCMYICNAGDCGRTCCNGIYFLCFRLGWRLLLWF